MDQNVRLSLDVVKINSSDIRLSSAYNETDNVRVKGTYISNVNYIDYLYLAVTVFALLAIPVLFFRKNVLHRLINRKTENCF